MEHGLTPSAIATRLIYMSAPENLQGAVSAGLLAVGSSFVGTMENCAALLDRIAAAADPEAEARAIARHHKALKSPVPGFGHHLHKPVDPRAYKLLDMGRADPELAGRRNPPPPNPPPPPGAPAGEGVVRAGVASPPGAGGEGH